MGSPLGSFSEKMRRDTPRLSSERTSLRMKVCDKRGQELTTYATLGSCLRSCCIRSFVHEYLQATRGLGCAMKRWVWRWIVNPLHISHLALCQRFLRKARGVQHIDQMSLGEQSGSRRLLCAGSTSRDDQRVLLQVQHLR